MSEAETKGLKSLEVKLITSIDQKFRCLKCMSYEVILTKRNKLFNVTS